MATSPTPTVEDVSSGADTAKVVVAALLVIGGLVAFYALDEKRWEAWQRVGALLLLLASGVAVFFTSETGKRLIAFGRDSYREVQKVVWPTGQEAMQMTGYVFAFVVVMAIFLWVADKTIEWVLYDLILGWRR